MTIEDRVVSLEEGRRWHEAQVNLLTSIAERAQASIERMDARLEEQRRDSQKTQRLWVRLCKKYGWLDDEDLLG